MIDFQNGGLEHQVYELIVKMCDLGCSDEFPKFTTKQLENRKWECILTIPGVKTTSSACGSTEVESINQCALKMLFILKRDHDKDQLDPDIKENIFRGNIEQFFGNINYDSAFRYRLCETDILINPHAITTFKLLENYAADTIKRLHEQGEEIDQMSQIVSIRFLVKQKKKEYC